ncbi:MAG: protease [Candidatus Sungbacteria bacterium RIFCSPLOWO2_12_FULL_41_11]|uniref:Protease n=1 Tax=Candidatus Sungbacteria bacterium RIFCSPLOWO2_12_FULL_41_11 TaxID=1802286 RepID=A0A1G2LMP3_9BACT|nr:MAG: hypothetical protein UV01_C0013G0011 [Parcubacteria group bacterium GW2011_GWA2_42_14]OGZ98782.1 MAG: protease [Candidatus Sungbacteria bacterium RIFCSPHIGHO2_02_FULL_41_12b]OHA12885.1 MAG: protease [Candidatus Sungbacteria bacterium RIFCSPLOWO2_12_FULL_41_11]
MAYERVTIELGEHLKQDLRNVLNDFKKAKNCVSHADARINISEGQYAASQNGILKGSGRDYSLELHTRVIAGRKVNASGYYGISLGPTDIPDFAKIVKMALEKSYGRAMANAEHKFERMVSWKELGNTLWDTRLARVPIHEKTIPAKFLIWPLDVSLDTIGKTVKKISKELKKNDAKLQINDIYLATWVEREIFASAEGALIDQTFCYTQGITYVLAVSKNVQQEHYDCFGHQRGWEIVENGVNEEFTRFPNFRQFSFNLAHEASTLSACPPCPWTDKPVVVITDPHYNTLKVHEIVGHPTELDRILKMETAYAGRSWLFKNFEENMLGKRVGSALLNAYSDPTLPGYGHYQYDHEGTPAKRVWHIKNGILLGFMNSRQTSAIFGDTACDPNGHWKANGGQVVPLIRMSNTVFAEGDKNPNDIISEVEHGYYLVGHRIPSIAESRENFRISARKVYEIKNGKPVRLYRDGGMMADTHDYFMNVDAVGNDFRLYPIFNCGKGQPMQAKRLGNGGPTMRSRAKLTGGAK